MGVFCNRPDSAKDLVSAWLGSSSQGQAQYGSTAYVKKSWLAGCPFRSKLRDCHAARDISNHSGSSVDDNSSQNGSVASDSLGFTSQSLSSHTSTQSAVTDLTDYSENEDEKSICGFTKENCLSNGPGLDFAQKHVDDLTGLEQPPFLVPDQRWTQPYATIPSVQPTSHPRQSNKLNDDSTTNNRRRSASQHSTQSPPCRLKRDTESTDQFVTLLIVFATRLVTAIWPRSASPPMMSTSFNGAGVLPLRVFIQETLRRSKTSYSTLQVALFYLVLLKDKLPARTWNRDGSQSCPALAAAMGNDDGDCPGRRAMKCGRRMFLSALMLASKYLQDRNYSTRAWSKISGLRTNEINENEREYLKAIDFDLHLPKEAFDNWSKIVLALSKVSKHAPQDESADPLSSFSDPGFGLGQLLSDLGSDTSSEDQSSCKFSEQWWTNLLQGLDPGMIRNNQQTETFLDCNVGDLVDAIPSFAPLGILTPPTSPESSGSCSSDANFSDALRSQPGDRQSTVSLPSTPVPSPGPSTALPMRPHPSNLPTPQSTPGPLLYCSLPREVLQRPTLRCSASLNALRSAQKQNMMNATLDRCPPPRPQSLVLPPLRTELQPAALNSDFHRQINSTSCLSPLSTASITSTSTTTSLPPLQFSRSRSSSITSNASESSWWANQPALMGVANVPSAFTAIAKPTEINHYPVERPWSPDSDGHQTSIEDSQLQQSMPSTFSFTNQSCATNDDSANKVQNVQGSNREIDAVEILLAMGRKRIETQNQATRILTNKTNTESSTHQPRSSCLPCPRFHKKRTLSRVDEFHSQVRDALASESSSDRVLEDPIATTHTMHKNRLIQTPTKRWAESKVPMSNAFDTKRIAMQCPFQSFTSAPEVASRFLKGAIGAK